MCGITGFWGRTEVGSNELATRMASEIASRGPDDCGVWSSGDGLALAHRRLAILDLSPTGHQPMISECGRFVLVYNGEIYNHPDLRRDLSLEFSCINWRGSSDTETLLVAIQKWGLKKTLSRLNGMFAFAVWDCIDRELILVRDRIGEKPVYYGVVNGTFLFGSQLKALSKHSDWQGEINRSALSLFMKYGYIPAPLSIYDNVYKLEAGHYVSIKDRGAVITGPTPYWALDDASSHVKDKYLGDDATVVDEVEALILDSIKLRLAADVPVGAFLSGGIDSSTIVALAQSLSDDPIKTFTIGFNESEYNEANHAREIAELIGTDHKEVYVTPDDLLSLLTNLSSIYDEPFSDPSLIPTLVVSELASRHVTVSLSGDGGDELFFGYDRYKQAMYLWRVIRHIPLFMRRKLARSMMAEESVVLKLFSLLPAGLKPKHLQDRLPKLARILLSESWISFYDKVITQGNFSNDLIIDSSADEGYLQKHFSSENLDCCLANRATYIDMSMYLPDNILVKLDRASMSVGLEARVPLLDHRLIELSRSIPLKYKYKKGVGKWVLRQVLKRYIPENITNRPKQGFSVPIEAWLKGPLMAWGDDLLSAERLRSQGLVDVELVREMWDEHQSGARRWHAQLWRLLIFQIWYNDNIRDTVCHGE